VVSICLASSPHSPSSTLSRYTLKSHLGKHEARHSDAASFRSEQLLRGQGTPVDDARYSISILSTHSSSLDSAVRQDSSHGRMTIPEALRQARNLHRLDTDAASLNRPYSNASASSTYSNPFEYTLPSHRRGPSTGGTASSEERLSVPTGQGWDGFSPISPETQPRLLPVRASGSSPVDNQVSSSGDLGQPAGSSGLSIASSQFPAGFSVFPAMEPPPAYVSMYVPPESRGQHLSTYKGGVPP
jgi:hypothetical protein